MKQSSGFEYVIDGMPVATKRVCEAYNAYSDVALTRPKLDQFKALCDAQGADFRASVETVIEKSKEFRSVIEVRELRTELTTPLGTTYVDPILRNPNFTKEQIKDLLEFFGQVDLIVVDVLFDFYVLRSARPRLIKAETVPTPSTTLPFDLDHNGRVIRVPESTWGADGTGGPGNASPWGASGGAFSAPAYSASSRNASLEELLLRQSGMEFYEETSLRASGFRQIPTLTNRGCDVRVGGTDVDISVVWEIQGLMPRDFSLEVTAAAFGLLDVCESADALKGNKEGVYVRSTVGDLTMFVGTCPFMVVNAWVLNTTTGKIAGVHFLHSKQVADMYAIFLEWKETPTAKRTRFT